MGMTVKQLRSAMSGLPGDLKTSVESVTVTFTGNPVGSFVSIEDQKTRELLEEQGERELFEIEKAVELAEQTTVINLCYDEEKDAPINLRLRKRPGGVCLERVDEFGEFVATLAKVYGKDGVVWWEKFPYDD